VVFGGRHKFNTNILGEKRETEKTGDSDEGYGHSHSKPQVAVSHEKSEASLDQEHGFE